MLRLWPPAGHVAGLQRAEPAGTEHSCAGAAPSRQPQPSWCPTAPSYLLYPACGDPFTPIGVLARDAMSLSVYSSVVSWKTCKQVL